MTTTPQNVLSPLEQARDERLFPVLTPEQLTRASSYGTARSVRAEEVLLAPGAQTGSIFIVLHGQVDITRQSCEEEIVVVRLGPGQFTGEVAALTGQQSLMLVRSGGLADSMSRYLIRRIEQHDRIDLRVRTQIVAMEGDGHLGQVTWRDASTGDLATRPIRHVFVMAGAVPNTKWLDGCLALDEKGFIKTGPDLTREELQAVQWPLPR